MSELKDGWGDDELNVDIEDEAQNESGWDWDDDHDISMPTDPKQEDDGEPSELNGWNDDFDEISSYPEQEYASESQLTKYEEVEKGLTRYVQSLGDGTLIQFANKILAAEKNNRETALELCHYYHARPQLREYTIDTEVPRMDYQIMISDELILTDPVEIQQYFTEHPIDNLVDDMLLRSANQSILADIIPVITGPDRIIRTQYMTSSHAVKVRFVLDMRDIRSLHIDCTMMISIPSGLKDHPKLSLATLRLMIEFSPEPSAPFVNYQLLSITPLIDLSKDQYNIRTAVSQMDPDEVKAITMASANEISFANFDHLRDNVLRSATIAQSGFEAAMRDLDGAVNFSRKINKLKTVIPVLPSIDDIIRAEESHNRSISYDREEPVEKSNISHTPQRHKPIIGGFLLSGISRLAKVASLPIEDHNVGSFSKSADSIPKLYRKDDDDSYMQNTNGKSTLSPLTHTTNIENTNTTEPDAIDENGWSDDDLNDQLDSLNNDGPLQCRIPEVEMISAAASDVSERDHFIMDHSINSHQTNASLRYEDERSYLQSKLESLINMTNKSLENPLPDDFVFDEITRIIPTRKRFVPKSEQIFKNSK